MTTSTTVNYYTKEVLPKLMKKFGYKNNLEAPRVSKVVVHVGTGQGLKDAKVIETAEDTLRRITGQQPVKTMAKKSISNFKIREGMVIGLKVTLRGKRMEDFLTRFIRVALPRVRDFQGFSKAIVDKTGNVTIGLNEHLSFPEISSDEVERIHGLEVTVDTTAKTQEEGLALLSEMGFPFQK